MPLVYQSTAFRNVSDQAVTEFSAALVSERELHCASRYMWL
jgi:hypothetical protein